MNPASQGTDVDDGSSTGGHTGTSGSGGAGATVDAATDAGAITDGSSNGGTSGTGGSSGGAGGVSGCQVVLQAISPPSFANIEFGPDTRLRVKGSVFGASTAQPVWRWTVIKLGGAVVATSAIDDVGSIIEFSVDTQGSYQITAQIAGDPTCHGMQVATAIPPQPPTFVLRTIKDGVPVQEKVISLIDPQPRVIDLDPGTPTSILPLQAGGAQALASYVRVTSPLFDVTIEGDTAVRALSPQLLTSVIYDVLVIPLDDTAPDLFTGTQGEWSNVLVLDPGVAVTARTLASDGSAVAGAHLVLRRGERPSTLGTSDATGAMTLRTRAGTMAAFIEPPPTSGLPRATVGTGTDPGIVLDPSVSSLDLRMTWAPITAAPLSFDVRGVDGSARAVGASVRVRSQGAATPVGTLVARPLGGASVTLAASGAIDVQVVSDATGVATFPSLPIGTYDVTVIPGPGSSPAAITSTTVTLARPGLARMVTLAGKVALSGTLLPAPNSAGTRVTAIDSGVTAAGTVVSAIVGTDGGYTLSVDPGRSYQLVAEPPVTTGLGRAVLGTILVAAGGTTVAARPLPSGHAYAGRITTGGVNAVGGALVQVFCPRSSSRCLDPTFALAAAITSGDGTFQLLLPEPPAN